MMPWCQWLVLILAIFLSALRVQAYEKQAKTAVFLSPEFVLGPGEVHKKIYHSIDFPTGHIAIKDFHGELVDEKGIPVPLYETYIHHWAVGPEYVPKVNGDEEFQLSKNIIAVRNSGVCQGNELGQYFGSGSETRKTKTFIPDPYGIEVGNPVEIPDGYEERWWLDMHAIDTRGVVDNLGCTECRCDLYNVTTDMSGKPLHPGYTGGLLCCYDQTQCRVQEGFEGIKRSIYMRYTVKWVDWEDTVVPVKIYILDVTDSRQKANDSARLGSSHDCQIEYDVESCDASDLANDGCVNTRKTSIVMPHGGSVIFGFAHQHSGALGSTLYKEDGQIICTSLPIYGQGKEAGNEAGYVVGMSSCHLQPGTVRISEGEALVLESNYNSTLKHTGLMGFFHIFLAEDPPKTMLSLPTSAHEMKMLSNYSWALVFVGVAAAVFISVGYFRRNEREGDYQSI